MASGRRVNIPLAFMSAVALVVVAASNALFAYELGGSFEFAGWHVDGLLLAAASVSVAVFQADRAAAALRGDRLAWVFLAVCLSYSLGAMASHVMRLQQVQEQTDEAAGRGYELARGEYERQRSALAAVGLARAPGEIHAAIDAARVPPGVRRRSKDCTDITEDETRRECAPIIELRSELARAERRAVIEPKLEDARTRLESIKRPPARTAAQEFLRSWLPWALAIALEALETFGFAFAVRGAAISPVKAPPAPSPVAPPGPTPKARSGRGPDALFRLLDRIESGSSTLPGAAVAADGWVSAGQADLAGALGVSKTTVNNWISGLASSGRVQKRADGRGTALKIIRSNVVSLTA